MRVLLKMNIQNAEVLHCVFSCKCPRHFLILLSFFRHLFSNYGTDQESEPQYTRAVKKMLKEARNLYVSCFFLVWKMLIRCLIYKIIQGIQPRVISLKIKAIQIDIVPRHIHS